MERGGEQSPPRFLFNCSPQRCFQFEKSAREISKKFPARDELVARMMEGVTKQKAGSFDPAFWTSCLFSRLARAA
jgi:hypothetical protein